MSSKSNCLSVSPGTVLSVVCLLLYSAGFIRIELKFNDHDQRLTAVEEVISRMKHGVANTWVKSKINSLAILSVHIYDYSDLEHIWRYI